MGEGPAHCAFPLLDHRWDFSDSRLYLISGGCDDGLRFAIVPFHSPYLYTPLAALHQGIPDSRLERDGLEGFPHGSLSYPEFDHTGPLTAKLCSQLWGRLATCGGLITLLLNCKQASRRRLPTGAQDAILPHIGNRIRRSQTSAKSGDMVYSEGTYTMTVTNLKTKKAMTDKGKFMTVYTKQADGSWKAVADTFNSDSM